MELWPPARSRRGTTACGRPGPPTPRRSATSSSGILAGGTPGSDVLVVTDRRGTIIGHGMVAEIPGEGRPAVDMGLVMADHWQGQGLGAVLLGLLACRAAGRGSRTLQVEVLPENAGMIALFQHWQPGARQAWTRDAMVLSADLRGLQPSQAPALAA
jgi:GNAT superfamily N-acetyltransferase